MTEFRVQIEIDVDAEDHVEAAKQAYDMLRDPTAMPWVCDVFKQNESGRLGRVDRDGYDEPVRVDLNEVLDKES